MSLKLSDTRVYEPQKRGGPEADVPGDLPFLGHGWNVKRFRGGLVFKAHRRLYHSTLSSRVIKKKKRGGPEADVAGDLPFLGHGWVQLRRCPRARIYTSPRNPQARIYTSPLPRARIHEPPGSYIYEPIRARCPRARITIAKNLSGGRGADRRPIFLAIFHSLAMAGFLSAAAPGILLSAPHI